MARFILLAVVSLALGACSFKLNPNTLSPVSVPLSAGDTPMHFGELNYDSRLDRVLVPASGSDKLALIAPQNRSVQVIPGLTAGADPASGLAGSASAIAAKGLIFVIDGGGLSLSVVEPSSGSVLGSASLAAPSEIVRFVPPTNELWVTQPSLEQIEVFSVPDQDPFIPASTGAISIPKGPNGLVIDRVRGLAFANQSQIGMTAVIQVQTHGMIDQWGNGCSDARGMAVDEKAGYLIVGCNEGKVVLMDITNEGHQLASQVYGGGINFVAYNPRLQHIYLPSGASAILAVFGIRQGGAGTLTPQPTASSDGSASFSLVRLGTADTAVDASCITVDDKDGIWVCDPANGQVIYFVDTFPALAAP